MVLIKRAPFPQPLHPYSPPRCTFMSPITKTSPRVQYSNISSSSTESSYLKSDITHVWCGIYTAIIKIFRVLLNWTCTTHILSVPTFCISRTICAMFLFYKIALPPIPLRVPKSASVRFPLDFAKYSYPAHSVDNLFNSQGNNPCSDKAIIYERPRSSFKYGPHTLNMQRMFQADIVNWLSKVFDCVPVAIIIQAVINTISIYPLWLYLFIGNIRPKKKLIY